MKLIFLFILLIPLVGLSQIDTSAVRINGIVLKGKDADAAAALIQIDPNRYQVLDSVFKTKYIPTKPGNNTDVTFDGVPNREWVRIYKAMSTNAVCLRKSNGHFDKLDTELRLHGSAYLIHKMDLEVVKANDEDDKFKKAGQNYASKTDTNIDID